MPVLSGCVPKARAGQSGSTPVRRALAHWQSPGVVAAIAVGISGPTAPQPVQAGDLCPNRLPQALQPILARNDPAAQRWGIAVSTLGGQSIYRFAGDQLRIPASNQKLVVTAAALKILSPNFRRTTQVWVQPAANGAVNLAVQGVSDPALNRDQLRRLAGQVRQAGIRRVATLSGFDVPATQYWPKSWPLDDRQEGFGAPLNRLILDENALNFSLVPQTLGQPLAVRWDRSEDGQGWTVRNRSRTVATGQAEFVDIGRDFNRPVMQVAGQLQVSAAAEPVALAVTQPTENFLQLFQLELTRLGMPVSQTARQPWGLSPTGQIVAQQFSPTVLQLVQVANRKSQNLYAEALLSWLGESQDPQAADFRQAGLRVMQQILPQLGLDPLRVKLADGAGLSRDNRLSADGLTSLLVQMGRSPYAKLFRESLPLAGETGGLRRRYAQSPWRGRLWAKTGTMTGVTGLSGYLNPVNFEPLAFSLLLNDERGDYSTLNQQLDRVVAVLDRLRRC
jgi:serine-type D-Ala-D-Ala carboxypeptidase/endopeptidase (penicillin-binding protein 4)